MTEGRFVSPNNMLAAAKEHMLRGQEPKTKDDWSLVMNFICANLAKGFADAAKLIRSIYEMPLSDKEIMEIWNFQEERKS